MICVRALYIYNVHTDNCWNSGSQSVDVAKFLLNLVGGDNFSSLYHSWAFLNSRNSFIIFTSISRAVFITFPYIHAHVIDGWLNIFTRKRDWLIDLFLSYFVFLLWRLPSNRTLKKMWDVVFNLIKLVLIKLNCRRTVKEFACAVFITKTENADWRGFRSRVPKTPDRRLEELECVVAFALRYVASALLASERHSTCLTLHVSRLLTVNALYNSGASEKPEFK